MCGPGLIPAKTDCLWPSPSTDPSRYVSFHIAAQRKHTLRCACVVRPCPHIHLSLHTSTPASTRRVVILTPLRAASSYRLPGTFCPGCNGIKNISPYFRSVAHGYFVFLFGGILLMSLYIQGLDPVSTPFLYFIYEGSMVESLQTMGVP